MLARLDIGVCEKKVVRGQFCLAPAPGGGNAPGVVKKNHPFLSYPRGAVFQQERYALPDLPGEASGVLR